MPATTASTAATAQSSTLPLHSFSNASSSSATTTTTTAATTAANSSASPSPSSSAPSPVPHSLFAAVRALEVATAASTRGSTFTAPCNCFSPLTPQRTHDIHAWLHGRAWPSTSPSFSSFSATTELSAASPPSFAHDDDDDDEDGSMDSGSDENDYDHRRHNIPASRHTPAPVIPCRRARSPHHPVHQHHHHHHHHHHHLHQHRHLHQHHHHQSPPQQRCTDSCRGCVVALAAKVCQKLLELDEEPLGTLLGQLSKTVFPEVCRRAWASREIIVVPACSSSSSSTNSDSSGSSGSSSTGTANGNSNTDTSTNTNINADATGNPSSDHDIHVPTSKAPKIIIRGQDDEEGFEMLLRLLAACAEPLESRAHLVSVLARRLRRCLVALVTLAQAAGDLALVGELAGLVQRLDGSDLIACRKSGEQMRLLRRLRDDIWEVRRDRAGVVGGGCGYFL